MRGVHRRLYRERRRIALVAFLTFLGGGLAFQGSSLTVFKLPLEIAAAFAFMVGLTGPLIGDALLFPQMRLHAETVALGIPVVSVMGAFDPSVDNTTSSLMWVIALLFIYLAGIIYGGTALDSLVPRRNRTYCSTSKSSLTPAALWRYLCVTPDSLPEFRQENTISLEWIEPETRLREIARIGDAATVEEVHTILAKDPPSLFQFHFLAVHAPDAPGHRGIYTHRLTKTDGGSILETVRQYDTDSWRAALYIWVDDGFGRSDDAKIKSFEAKELARRSKIGGDPESE